MASTSEKIEQALELLKRHGHEVPEKSVSVGADALMRIAVDRRPRTFEEIYEMANALLDLAD